MSTRPHDEPVNIAEIGMHVRDLENRTMSLYLADPMKMPEIRNMFDEARATLKRLAGALPRSYGCPAGTVRCRYGCCYPTRTGLSEISGDGE